MKPSIALISAREIFAGREEILCFLWPYCPFFDATKNGRNAKSPALSRRGAFAVADALACAIRYFFFLAGAFFAAENASSTAAWAAARRATGTRYGEQLT
ncbi:hypothetical protein OpiT1DRAFT_00330 [Opitutaceae bacterium TAV1]|nr:hypothetical protein OpiT1DRAFT_00330 [Opitutaceae bacterium TAV1]